MNTKDIDAIDAFEEIFVKKNGFILEWEYIGEGVCGDYDEQDPEDKPLLRFSCYKELQDGTKEEIDDSSYCTNLYVGTQKEMLETLGMLVLENLIESYPNHKKVMERMSWVNENWIKH